MRSHCLLAVLALVLAGCGDAQEPPASSTAWRVHRAEAAEDHPAEVMLTRDADGAWDGVVPRLVIGCLDEETSVDVEWGRPLGEGPLPVTVRLGDGPEQDVEWRPSTDGEAAGLWTDSASVPFIRSLVDQERLRVHTSAEDGSVLEATFTLTGLGDHVGEVEALCAWPGSGA